MIHSRAQTSLEWLNMDHRRYEFDDEDDDHVDVIEIKTKAPNYL